MLSSGIYKNKGEVVFIPLENDPVKIVAGSFFYSAKTGKSYSAPVYIPRYSFFDNLFFN